MTKQEEKKTWATPELIVLIRNKPEEAVLWACKDFSQTGDISYFDTCGIQGCGACEFRAGS